MQTLSESITPKFAVSYLRVSTRDQAERGGGADEGFSLPAQREANKRKAHSIGAFIGKEFVDRGASARSAARPELQKMLEYIKENRERIDYVIVHKVDRLARNRGDDIDITRILRDADVQLVSASESIDETPAGMLLHGIMSSIAEFYSQNLATEVRKGMGEKVRSGGTISKAPLGYLNVRRTDAKGREERTVELDPARAPLLTQAFQKYATGDWTVHNLAEQLALQGLNTRTTPNMPSIPVDRGILNKVFVNSYYKGIVTYKGVEYKGNHPAIVDAETWQKVQDILSSRFHGERTRDHPHFLKSTLYCKSCGSRMLVSNAKSHTGARYLYFVCAGRHSKRENCRQRAVLIEEVEHCVERIYENYSLAPDIRLLLEAAGTEEIEKSRKEFTVEQTGLLREKEKLERRQKKLLEAHYNDAIPLDLLRSEQAQLNKALLSVEHRIKAHNTQHDSILSSLKKALDLIENCGELYIQADDYLKRIINQAIFKRLLVETDGSVSAELAEPFKSLVEPVEGAIITYNRARRENPSGVADFLQKLSNHIQYFFGYGLNKTLLVGLQGLEPRTNRL